MLFNRRELLRKSCAAVVMPGSAVGGGTGAIVSADFGVHPDGSDAGPGFARIMAALARQGGGRLIISPGVYRFAVQAGVVLRFESLRDISIEADGAVFLFSGLARPMIFNACHGVTIRGLTVDWARAPFSQGDIIEVADDRQSAVIALDVVTPMDGWTRVRAIGQYDRASGLITRRGLDAYDTITSVTPLAPRRVRLAFERPIATKTGSTVVLRHAIYEAHALEFRNSTDIRVDRVTVHSAPGMAFVGNRCRNITLSHCEVGPKPGSSLLMSTTADGAHFGDCSGEILVDACRFAAMGDDGVNVNTAYWRVVERPDQRTLVVSQWQDGPFRPDEMPPLGDLFEFASGATLEVLGEASVDSTSQATSAVRETLHFAADVPGAVKVGDYVADVARSPKTVIRGCRFENNRARGILAHKNTRIENCLFRNQSGSGIVLCPDAWWMEGPEIANVQIVGNSFDGVDRWEFGLGAIYVDAIVTGPDGRPRASTGRPNHDILIRDNTFRNLAGPKVSLRAIRM